MTESVVTIPPETAGKPRLEGVWHGDKGRSAVVAAPHPLMGGSMDNPVVHSIARGLAASGLRVLLFNFRGVGESDGMPSGELAHAEEDYRAVLAFAASATTVMVASGYSFGGATAIRCAVPLAGLHAFAVAPPPALLTSADLPRLTGRLSIVAAEHDSIALPGELQRLLTSVPGATLDVVKGADHFFGVGMGRIEEIAADLGRRAELPSRIGR